MKNENKVIFDENVDEEIREPLKQCFTVVLNEIRRLELINELDDLTLILNCCSIDNIDEMKIDRNFRRALDKNLVHSSQINK